MHLLINRYRVMRLLYLYINTYIKIYINKNLCCCYLLTIIFLPLCIMKLINFISLYVYSILFIEIRALLNFNAYKHCVFHIKHKFVYKIYFIKKYIEQIVQNKIIKILLYVWLSCNVFNYDYKVFRLCLSLYIFCLS